MDSVSNSAIYFEIERYLRDLTFKYHFYTIFEVIKRFEYSFRFGPNVYPIPTHPYDPKDFNLVEQKLKRFLSDLESKHGSENGDEIKRAFQSFTATTMPTLPDVDEKQS